MVLTNDMIIDSIINATPPTPSTARIFRVPRKVAETDDYKKNYVPNVVSIGPHHFGNPELESVEKLKHVFTMKLLSDNKETLKSLYNKLGEPDMVQELRSFYEENSTTRFCDKIFTKMMLMDSCFILYYIEYICYSVAEDIDHELIRNQDAFVCQDLFLLENQIPFKLITEVMKWVKINVFKLEAFISDNILAHKMTRNQWHSTNEPKMKLTGDNEPDHLLHLLHRTLTKNERVINFLNMQSNFRNVSELVDVGIHFKPSKDKSLVDVKFLKGWWWFSADLELPPIIVDNFTKPLFLNLIAHEMCSGDASRAWVTSYICLLDSLIRHPEDVAILRKAGVLHDYLGRDQEVVRLFNEIATGLVPNNSAYLDARLKLENHYKIWKYTLTSQIKHQYLTNPGVFFSYFGVISLFLSGVQTYFTIWSPKSK